MPAVHTDDAHWVLQCRAGDANAFEPLVRRYQNAAYAVALTHLRRRPDAQDLVQEAFITAYCKLHQLTAPAAFGSWLRAIVLSQCREWLRRGAHRSAHAAPVDEAERGIDEASAVAHRRQETNQDMWQAIDRLPEPYRVVVLLHYISGFSYEEIAAFLETPVSTVRGRLQQSRIRLKKLLSPREQEVLTMSQIDVTDNVQEAVCRIVKERIHQTVPMGDTRHIVLYCGIDTDVDIRQADGEDIVLEGTKIAVGFSAEDARASAAKLDIPADQVDRFLETGPHTGEYFLGTHENNDGVQRTRTILSTPVEEGWRVDLDLMRYLFAPPLPYPSVSDLYPALSPELDALTELPGRVQEALGRVTRLTVRTRKLETLEIPRPQYTGKVRRVFSERLADQHTVLGPAGYMALQIAIPRATTLTVFRARRVTASRLSGSLHLFTCNAEALSGIDGDLFLHKTRFRRIRGVNGRVWVRDFSHGATIGSRGQDWRAEPEVCEIAQVSGEVDIDVGRLALNASDLTGTVRIRNRFGSTTLTQRRHNPSTRCRIESSAGAIRLALAEEVFQKVNVTLHTLCGKLTRSQRVMERRHCASSGHDLMTFSTVSGAQVQKEDFLNVAYHLKTESGDITLETIA
jgi:RNA polymerase sigma-70 factor (ECF subfamily)